MSDTRLLSPPLSSAGSGGEGVRRTGEEVRDFQPRFCHPKSTVP